MKKFLFTFLLAAAVASAFTFVVAQEDQGDKKFVIHGEIRQRAEYLDNFTDSDSNSSDSGLFYPYRARLAAEGHFSKNVVGYAEFQYFGYWGDTPPFQGGDPTTLLGNPSAGFPSGTPNSIWQNFDPYAGPWFNPNPSNSVQLYQAWVGLNNIGGSKFSLKVGRQELVKGSEMLLGDLDFYSGISHDGLVGCFDHDSFDLDVWWTRPLQGFNFSNQPFDHTSINFYGAWADFKKVPKQINVAAYLMYFEKGQTPLSADGRSFYTIGGRANRDAVSGKNGFGWNVEYAMQSGQYTAGPTTNDTADISADAFEGMFGYNFARNGSDHLLQIKYVMASGNKDTFANGDKAKAFDPLFQDYHQRYGLSDVFTLSDLTAWSLGWNMTKKNHNIGIDYWQFQLTEDTADAAGSMQNDLGSEVDAWYKFQYNPNTQIMGGLAYFMPGDVIKFASDPNGGPTDAGLRLVGNLRLRF